MNKKLTITLPLMFLLCFGLVGQVFAQTRVLGVTFGDNLIYSRTSTWQTSNASAILPPYLVDTINGTLNYNVTVYYVAGNNVTEIEAWTFKNGTVINSVATINTDTDDVYDFVPNLPPFQGFYDANLQVNDPLYPGNLTIPLRINQTITRDYASGKRDTNLVEYSYQVEDATDPTNSTIGTQTESLYIDKATGVLVEGRVFSQFADHNGTELWTLQSTNLWAVSAAPLELPLPWPIIVAIVAVVVVVVAAAVYFRGKRHRRRKFRR